MRRPPSSSGSTAISTTFPPRPRCSATPAPCTGSSNGSWSTTSGCGGAYDRDYLDNRLRIGLIHHINGVELKWYLAAYRLYLEQMLAPLCGQGADAQLFSSLLKAVFFDMTLAIDTYSAAQRKALEDSEARFARALRGAHDGSGTGTRARTRSTSPNAGPR